MISENREMGYKNRAEQETNVSTDSSSLSEALLFATMCIIGLPVDVYVKDGSVYSGIFYTASVEKDYGIVLKKAKLTKKGKSNAIVANGTVIETLIILSGDLVEVVAKGVQLPADGIAGRFAGENVESVVGTISSDGRISEGKKSTRPGLNKRRTQKRNLVCNENGFSHSDVPAKVEQNNEEKRLPSNLVRNALVVEHGKRDGTIVTKIEEASEDSVNERLVGDVCSQVLELHREGNADESQVSSSNLGAFQAQMIPAEGGHSKTTLKQPNSVSLDPANSRDKPDNHFCGRPSSADNSSSHAACSSISSSSSPVADVTLAASTEIIPPQSSQTNKSFKEFKLNPGAKIFSPSFATPITASNHAVPTVASTPYIPSNSPVVPVAASQSEVGMNPYVPHSSVPAKFVPYGNFSAGNGGNAPQFSQPVVGHVGSRTQPVRYAGQFPVQSGPAYVHPNSQAVMVGRLGGQLLYVQPVSNDFIQGVTAISPVSTRPALTPHQVQLPKHQGNAAGQALQLCVPSPLIASGLQPFAVPGHIPVLQPPISPNRPIPVPRSNGLYSTKFP